MESEKQIAIEKVTERLVKSVKEQFEKDGNLYDYPNRLREVIDGK